MRMEAPGKRTPSMMSSGKRRGNLTVDAMPQKAEDQEKYDK